MSYEAHLALREPTSADWALAQARWFLRDAHEPREYSDVELTAQLDAFAFRHDGVTYYRPHVAAAAILTGDPDRAASESILGASVTHREVKTVANAVRNIGRWIDELIASEAGVSPPPARPELSAVF